MDKIQEVIDAIKGLKRSTQITLKRIYGWFLLHGHDASGNDVPLLAATNGELYTLNAGVDSTGAVQEFLVATDGEAYSLLVGRVDGTDDVQEFLVATDGTVYNAPVGVDRDNTFTSFLTTFDGAVVTDGVPYLAASVLVPSSEGNLFDPATLYSTTSADIFEVSFLVVNIDGAAAVSVSIGQDVGGAGALSDTEYWMYSEPIAATASSGWRGPFYIAGDDIIRGVASAAGDANIHFRVRSVN